MSHVMELYVEVVRGSGIVLRVEKGPDGAGGYASARTIAGEFGSESVFNSVDDLMELLMQLKQEALAQIEAEIAG